MTKTTPTPEKVKDQQTQGKDDEPRRAAETAFAAHKLMRHLRPEAHPLEGNEKGSRGTPPANQADHTSTGAP